MVKIEILNHKKHKFMFINNRLWMWDTPEERDAEKELADKSFGNVLVAGYGFGILTKALLKNPKVKSVTTVEKYKEVIEKMKEFGPIYGKIILGDFYDFPEDKKFDCVIGDIYPDIDRVFLKDYIKFKKKAEKLVKKNGIILAWGKEFFEYLIKNKRL